MTEIDDNPNHFQQKVARKCFLQRHLVSVPGLPLEMSVQKLDHRQGYFLGHLSLSWDLVVEQLVAKNRPRCKGLQNSLQPLGGQRARRLAQRRKLNKACRNVRKIQLLTSLPSP